MGQIAQWWPDLFSMNIQIPDKKTEDLVWSYGHGYQNRPSGIKFTEEELKDLELRRRMNAVIDNTKFAHNYKNIIDGIRQKSDSRLR